MTTTFRQSLDRARAGEFAPWPLFTIKARDVAIALWEAKDQQKEAIYNDTFMSFTRDLVLAYEEQLSAMPNNQDKKRRKNRLRNKLRPAFNTLWKQHAIGLARTRRQ
ncbi:hypothetical protein R3P38DRAFT_2804992 [Favolaschia claudopus]|uniref:Uncharacterized protein n=1 Tax=Favolaschia claudopus TaxID=2862362 RepID=A0AAV9ZND3_9AGAR